MIKKGDRVTVIAGNEKGKTSQVLARQGDKLVLQGLNIRKRHRKKTQQGAPQILQIEAPIHISNVKPAEENSEKKSKKVKSKKA